MGSLVNNQGGGGGGGLVNQQGGGTLQNQPGVLQTFLPNSAYFHTTGAISVWVGFPGQSGNIPTYFVGTCETYPEEETEITYEPIFTSTGGLKNPTDKSYEGSSEILILDLNRYNENVVDMMESAPRYGRLINSLQQNQGIGASVPNGSVPILSRRLDRGSLLIGNVGYYQLWLVYPSFGTVNATPDMSWGWFYYACSTAAVYVDRQGTQCKRRRLIIEAMEFNDQSGNWWGIKTNDPAALAGINILQEN